MVEGPTPGRPFVCVTFGGLCDPSRPRTEVSLGGEWLVIRWSPMSSIEIGTDLEDDEPAQS